MKWLVFTVTFLFITSIARTENLPFAILYSEVHADRWCASVGKSDMQAAGFKCPHGFTVENLLTTTAESYEKNAFNLAAPKQIQKNRCLAQGIQYLREDPQTRILWDSQLLSSWLGMKKSQMMFDRCEFEIQRRLSPADIKSVGMQEAYERSKHSPDFKIQELKPLEKEWQDVCFNENTLTALSMAPTLFQYTLSIVSDPEFFDDLENNRNILTNHTTGKVLTDKDIMNLNLKDQKNALSNVDMNMDRKFNNAIDESLAGIENDRVSRANQIEKSNDKGNYDLSRGLRTYMFDEGTVLDTLKEKKLLDENYENLSNIKAPGDKPEPGQDPGQKKVVTNGAFCILAKYEQTLGGELTETGGEAVLTAGLTWWLSAAIRAPALTADAARVIQLAKIAPEVASAQTAELTGLQRIAIAAVSKQGILSQIVKACAFRGVHDKTGKGVATNGKDDMDIAAQASDLPDSVGFQTWHIEIPKDKIPSCKNGEYPNLMIGSDSGASCIYDTLMSALPFGVALPALLVQKAFGK